MPLQPPLGLPPPPRCIKGCLTGGCQPECLDACSNCGMPGRVCPNFCLDGCTAVSGGIGCADGLPLFSPSAAAFYPPPLPFACGFPPQACPSCVAAPNFYPCSGAFRKRPGSGSGGASTDSNSAFFQVNTSETSSSPLLNDDAETLSSGTKIHHTSDASTFDAHKFPFEHLFLDVPGDGTSEESGLKSRKTLHSSDSDKVTKETLLKKRHVNQPHRTTTTTNFLLDDSTNIFVLDSASSSSSASASTSSSNSLGSRLAHSQPKKPI